MKNYRLEVYAYTPAGAVGERVAVHEADHPMSIEREIHDYQSTKQDNGMKAYKCVLFNLAYKQIADVDAFMAQFKA